MEENINGSTGSGREQCTDSYHQVDMCTWNFILLCIVLGLITATIILGNSLVIISVFLYRKLRKSVSNWFIASLALADLVLGILVLPLSASYEVMSYWVFGDSMCRIWLVVDVWVCTASILHLCMISIDRYIAIAFPLKYPFLMTHKRCRIICLCLWLLAFVICFPALINFPPDYSKNITTTTTTISLDTPKQCNVLDYPLGFTIYSAMGSFFIPSIIMSGFYIRIFLLAHKYLKQAQTGTIVATQSGGSSAMRIHRGGRTGVANPSACHSPESREHDCNRNEIGSVGWKGKSEKCEAEPISRDSSIVSRTVHEHQQTYRLLPNQRSSKIVARSVMINKETKAAKTVAIIVGCFIACWTPFFICYLKQGITKIDINVHLFHFFIWVGYINSLLNPCIYAFFSNDYRHAFKKILRCQVKRMKTRSKGVSRYFNSLYVSSTSGRTDTTHNRSGCPNLKNGQKLDMSDDHHSMI